METTLTQQEWRNARERLEHMCKFSEILDFPEANEQYLYVNADDGNLHLTAFQWRWCVCIGQGHTKEYFLAECKRALKALKITGVTQEELNNLADCR